LDRRASYIRDQAVAALWQRLDITRIFRRVAKSLPEPCNSRIQSMFEIDKGVIGPETLSEFFSGNDRSGLFQERSEYLKRLRLQSNPNAVFPQHGFIKVDLERAKPGGAACITRGLHDA
jgi:hypothetical protein